MHCGRVALFSVRLGTTRDSFFARGVKQNIGGLVAGEVKLIGGWTEVTAGKGKSVAGDCGVSGDGGALEGTLAVTAAGTSMDKEKKRICRLLMVGHHFTRTRFPRDAD